MSDSYPELQAVNVITELERLGWGFTYSGEDQILCKCPAHKDDTPSCGVNVRKKVWKCMAASCGASGDFISMFALLTKTNRSTVLEYIRKTYNVDSATTIDPLVVERYHERIWDAGPLRQELYDRGLDDDDIRRWRIGVDEQNRVTLPVWNDAGAVVNIRRYRPGAPTRDKMRNTRGCGKMRLHPVSQLKYDKIIIVGGECKAYVVAKHLNAYGYGAVSPSGGEGNWDASLSPRFKDKEVWVCYDIDKGGIEGTSVTAAPVRTFAKAVRDLTAELCKDLPADKYPKGDVNDYFGREKKTATEFLRLVERAQPWQPAQRKHEEEEAPLINEVHLSETTQADYARKRVRTKAVVTAMDTTPYVVPREVAVECDRNQKFCANCPVYAQEQTDEFVKLTISAESPAILELVNAGKKTKKEAIREGLKIPPCKSAQFHVVSHYNVEDVRISPQLELASRTSDSVMLPALTVTHGLEMNTAYEFTGRMYPHPRNQQAILLISSAKPAEDALSTYSSKDEDLEELDIFAPSEWTVDGLKAKLSDIYDDLSANVTRIFSRQTLHLFVDLAYHSPLLINFDGRREKGWAEVLIVGDSAQGKSEATRRLMEHYRLGEKVEVKNASAAGLLGGLQQLGARWMVTWGVIPRHDRRLVVLEELKGAPVEMIGRLTDMRSSGIAEIDKIEKRKTHARTRLIAISNPRSDQPVASYSCGVEAARELIGSPEDLRRFDAVLIVSSGEVDAHKLNQLTINRPQVEHKYTSELCQRCVLWAWTRTEDQVSFDKDAEVAVLEHTNDLCSRYVDVIPIIDRGSMRFKLARLAASLACRTGSFGETPQQVRVRKCHVDYIVQVLDAVYSSDVFGYKTFSDSYTKTRTLTDESEIRKRLLVTPFPADFVEQLLSTDEVELRDIQDWTSWDRPEALELLSFFVRKHALLRSGKAYRKNPKFTSLLRNVSSSDDMKMLMRPEFVKEPKSAF